MTERLSNKFSRGSRRFCRVMGGGAFSIIILATTIDMLFLVVDVSRRWLMLSGRKNCHIFQNDSCHHGWWVVAFFGQFENGGSVEVRFDMPHCLVSDGMRGALQVCDVSVAKE